ncbi:Muscle M-line assembly protein unc-89 [Wickerhamomyces ciferrii]|uniref:Muscle M-line assembly protein unc-89 n=1 Tax=Wickerhamomyces ciferrii (strain ATCC 14091 / BCRC 22168 / CBS 111 / JCM 3599 / NBRC 0793 / NRRL Y-1031 F-60-10) TaxID=1206466 RepID=K0KTS5_WICCF|nr:Muscle M-line assembly protein unc-89 [Wickerhamomyces ciferrii]CCH44769.1 Muscle M-line assembly protein unc-89 [Wickerhamomyces ciferrii]
MTEPDNSIIKSPKREQELVKEPVIPSTPERKKRSSSITSDSNNNDDKKQEDIIPQTPPSQRRKLSIGNFQSPGDLIPNLPPTTPSLNSSGKFRLSNVPQTPFSGKTNTDLTTSPLKSPSQFHRDDQEELEKPPIRQISSTLKARLSYAFVKYQHGWANQSLDELEKNVMNKDSDLDEPFHELVSSQRKGDPKTYEEFWDSTQQQQQNHLQVKSSPRKNKSPSKITKPNSNNLLKSPTKIKIDHSLHINEFENDDGSANRAFLQAISKSRSPKKRPNLQTNLRIDANKFQQDKNQNPEAEAIESLMSLSSPQSFKSKLELNTSNQQHLPKQKLSFGESLSSHSNSSSQHQSVPNNDNAIETDSDTEYEESNTTDEEDISTQELSQTSQGSQTIQQPSSNDTNADTNVETDEEVDIRTDSNPDS